MSVCDLSKFEVNRSHARQERGTLESHRLLTNRDLLALRPPSWRRNVARIRNYCSLSPGFAGERAGVRGRLESRSHVDIPVFSMGLSIKTSAKRSDVRPLTLTLSPEYRGEGTIEIPSPCDNRPCVDKNTTGRLYSLSHLFTDQNR